MIKLIDILKEVDLQSKLSRGHKPDWYQLHSPDFKPFDEDEDIEEGTRCWKGYEKKGMKTMFGKRVPNCVKKEAQLPKDGFSDKEQMIMYDDVEENVATDHDGKAAPYGSGYDEVEENFADGKKPGRKGISKRVGIPKGATLTQLAKLAKAKGEKGRMARWQLNMRRGKKKKK